MAPSVRSLLLLIVQRRPQHLNLSLILGQNCDVTDQAHIPDHRGGLGTQHHQFPRCMKGKKIVKSRNSSNSYGRKSDFM